MPEHDNGLARLERQLEIDFERLNLPVKSWCPPSPESGSQCDILIVGAGMCGLAAAFALRCQGVTAIRHIDHHNDGYEGPWLNYARMQTLRSPKHLTGPALGFANLTFRAWYEAQHGSDGWETLDRIGRTVWMDYLRWYRRVTGAQVENNIRLTSIQPFSEQVVVSCTNANGNSSEITTRQLILATGREGQSQPRVPKALVNLFSQSDHRIQHSSDSIDFSALAGARVAVVGLSASAFDNAATALEAGASQVTILGRADALPSVNKMKQTVYPGFTHGYPLLSDDWKIRIMRYIAQTRIAPPRGSVLRIADNPRAELLLDAEITRATDNGNSIQLTSKKGDVAADYVILATGFSIDLHSPPECQSLAAHILRWGDRMPNEPLDEWMNAPCLGDGFEFLSRPASPLPGLDRIRCFTHTAQLSLGNLANDIPAVSEGAFRLATSVTAALFAADIDYHWQRLTEYREPELLGYEWPV